MVTLTLSIAIQAFCQLIYKKEDYAGFSKSWTIIGYCTECILLLLLSIYLFFIIIILLVFLLSLFSTPDNKGKTILSYCGHYLDYHFPSVEYWG